MSGLAPFVHGFVRRAELVTQQARRPTQHQASRSFRVSHATHPFSRPFLRSALSTAALVVLCASALAQNTTAAVSGRVVGTHVSLTKDRVAVADLHNLQRLSGEPWR